MPGVSGGTGAPVSSRISADTPAPPRRCCLAALAPAGWTGRYAASRSFRCRRGFPPEAACPALIERRGQRLSRRNRQPGWRIIIPEAKDRGGGALSWRVAVPWDNRDTFIEMAGRHLGCYGWDAVAWPTEIGTTMTIPLIRNTSGHQIDEAERLHRAAGVTYHKAHHAYIAAVAATVEAAGIVIGDIGSDCDEPRGGLPHRRRPGGLLGRRRGLRALHGHPVARGPRLVSHLVL